MGVSVERHCPRCGTTYVGFPALSRVDNSTYVCSPCGTEEGLDNLFNIPLKELNK